MPPVVQDLFSRRVPQYLAIYVGASWGAVQFVNFLEGRYLLSPHLTDLTLLGLALLMPSVALFTYYHGRPGADHWVAAEKIGIPANVLFTVAVLFFVFAGKDLGAVTTTVAVTDEDGKRIEREVPKANFRKRLALFNFEVPAGDTALAWLRYGLTLGVAQDLNQDMFVDLRLLPHFRDELRKAGFADGNNVPVSLQRKLADDLHLGYFVSGSVAREGNGLRAGYTLREASDAGVVQERSLTAPDFAALVDAMSLQLRRDLELPSRHLEETQDLPLTELMSKSPEALRLSLEAMEAIHLRDAWPDAMARLERAVALDPTYAYAQYALARVYMFGNQAQRALAPLQAAMDHLYRIPERDQFQVKSDYYFLRQDVDKAIAVLEMKAELFPHDIQTYLQLAQINFVRDRKREAIANFERVLELDPEQHEWLKQIGGLHQALGEFEEALGAYERYAKQFPDSWDALTPIARLYSLQGDHPRAREYYDKALLLEPSAVQVMVSLANLERDLGNFAAAESQLRDALAASKTAEDRYGVYSALDGLHERRGEMARAVEAMELGEAEGAKFQPPFVSAVRQLSGLGTYVKAGQMARAQEKHRALAAQLQPPMNMFVPLGALDIALAAEDAAQVRAAISAVEQVIAAFSYKFLEPYVAFAKGRAEELSGDCAKALPHYQEQLRLSPTDPTAQRDLGRCQRKLGQRKQAEESLNKMLKVVPADPHAHYELGLLFAEAGNPAKALEHLRAAMQVWQNADAEYKHAREARAKLAELEGAVARR